jgi:glycosyltransferase involved in cell wall biosynthesis
MSDEISALPISVLIMTYNEEVNIKYTIESLIGRFNQIIVTDSYSEDKTCQICADYHEVELYSNKFEHWATQRNWILNNCKIKNEWVFFLDADESINLKFFKELKNKFENELSDDISSFFLKKDLYFLNKKLKFSYSHPKIKLIFKKTNLKYQAEGAREFAISEGNSLEIKTPLIHKDRRPFDYWIIKHINNANRECEHYLNHKNNKNPLRGPNNLNFGLKVRKFIRYKIWNKIPLGFRPVIYFLFRYLIRLGFLDGRPGFIYCVNHALWYELLIDTKLLEKKISER